MGQQQTNPFAPFRRVMLMSLYREAVKNFPVLKYSWVIVATIAVMVLAASFKLDIKSVFTYALIVLGITLLGFILSLLTKNQDGIIRIALYIIVYAVTIAIAVFTLGLAYYLIDGEKPAIYSRIFPPAAKGSSVPNIYNNAPFNYTVILKDSIGDQVRLGNERLTIYLNGKPYYAVIDTFSSRFLFDQIDGKFFNRKVNINLRSDQFTFAGGKSNTDIYLNGTDTFLMVHNKISKVITKHAEPNPAPVKKQHHSISTPPVTSSEITSKHKDTLPPAPGISTEPKTASGMVLDAKGNPVENARISVLDGKYTAVTNIYGEYQLNLSPSEPDLQLLRVSITKDGYAPTSDYFNFPSENHRAILKPQPKN